MTYDEFVHGVRAAAEVASTDELLVFGSQAILVHDADPPIELRQSIELDVVPMRFPEQSDRIDGVLGELSPFHQTFGFYVHGVGFETATFPSGWRGRCLRVEVGTPPVTVVCPELHDLAASKLAAGRDKDFDYVSVLIDRQYVKVRVMARRVSSLPVSSEIRERLGKWLGAINRRSHG